MRDDLVDEVLVRNLELPDTGLLDLADMPERDAPILLDDDLAADLDVERRGLAAQPFGVQLERDALGRQHELVLLEEQVQDVLIGVFERAQQDADRELAPAVDADEDAVLGVELEI